MNLSIESFWEEDHQLEWLTSGYLIGHGLSSKSQLHEVVFCRTSHNVTSGGDLMERCSGIGPGQDFFERKRDRLWRFLDIRHRYGTSKTTSTSLASLSSLAVLSPDPGIQKLAAMVFYLQMFQSLIMKQDHYNESLPPLLLARNDGFVIPKALLVLPHGLTNTSIDLFLSFRVGGLFAKMLFI